ncbi:MAG: ABC transporter substrate-binding protein [Actinomycetota bacterium]
MPRRPRLLLLLSLALVIAAACGDSDADDAAEASTPATEAATTEANAADAAEPAAGTEGDTEPADGDTITVIDATGEVTVPQTTEGIATLEEVSALNLLMLGVTPETSSLFFQEPFPLAILDAEGVPVNAGEGELNVEYIATLGADLLVAINHPIITELRDPIVQGVAPIVITDFLANDWVAQLELLAEVTGTEERAAALIAAVDQEIETLAADIDAGGMTGSTFSFLFANFDGSLQIPNGGLAVDIIDAVGLVRPDSELAVAGADDVVPLSIELLGEHDADFMIIGARADAELDPTISDLRTDDGVSLVTNDWGWGVENPITALWIIEDIRRIVLRGEEPLGDDDIVEIWNSVLALPGSGS